MNALETTRANAVEQLDVLQRKRDAMQASLDAINKSITELAGAHKIQIERSN